MAMRDDLERCEFRLTEQIERNNCLEEKLQEAQEELRHYRAAVAAVKWLWDRANEQQPFQL
jgi:hypothetical protein